VRLRSAVIARTGLVLAVNLAKQARLSVLSRLPETLLLIVVEK